MGELSNWLTESNIESAGIDIAQKIEATFGPNPCTRLHWQEGDNGDVNDAPCNSKRCHDCGPRKQLELQLQLQAAFGDYCYIQSYTTKDELDTVIERIRKRAHRSATEWKYAVVGDDYLGWILSSNLPPAPSTTLKTLGDWIRRITHAYRYGDGRLRRSRSMSRLTLRKRKSNTGQPSIWRLVTRRWVPAYAIPDTLDELLTEIETEHYFRKRDWLDQHIQQGRSSTFVAADEWVDPA